MDESNNFKVYQIDDILDYIEFSAENLYILKPRMLSKFKEDKCYIYDIRNNLLFVKGIVTKNSRYLVLLNASKTHLHKVDDESFLNKKHYLDFETFVFNDTVYQNCQGELIRGYKIPTYKIK